MFTHKSLVHQTKSRTPIFKYLTMFFLGASAVLLMTQAFDINTTLNNAVQYIGQIILTTDGSAIADTGIILDGSNGNAFFSGNVGIGVTTPSQSLEVNGNIALSTAGRIGATGNQVYMATDGNVGIGTNNPDYPLHIKGTIGGLFLEGDTMSTLRFGSAGYSRTDYREMKKEGAFSNLYLYYKDTTGSGTSLLATFTTGGKVGIGTDSPSQALEISGNIALSTAGRIGATSGQVYMATNGYVGVGASSLTEKFQVDDYAWIGQENHIGSNDIGGTFLRLHGVSPDMGIAPPVPKFSPNIQLNYDRYDMHAPLIMNSNNRMIDNDLNLLFKYATGHNIYDTKMTITSDGKVGIGVTPTEALDVLGNIQADGDIIAPQNLVNTNCVRIDIDGSTVCPAGQIMNGVEDSGGHIVHIQCCDL